jgi:hypothetical protein
LDRFWSTFGSNFEHIFLQFCINFA